MLQSLYSPLHDPATDVVFQIPLPLFLSYQYKSVFLLDEAVLKKLNDKTKDLNQFHVVNCGIFKII